MPSLNNRPADTGRPGCLLNVLCTLNLRPVSTGRRVVFQILCLLSVLQESLFIFQNILFRKKNCLKYLRRETAVTSFSESSLS